MFKWFCPKHKQTSYPDNLTTLHVRIVFQNSSPLNNVFYDKNTEQLMEVMFIEGNSLFKSAPVLH
jgi:hypothetical protein